jgi:hypothetical protein
MCRSRNILSAAGDALLRTLPLYGNGTDDLLPDDMPIYRSALRTRFFEHQICLTRARLRLFVMISSSHSP